MRPGTHSFLGVKKERPAIAQPRQGIEHGVLSRNSQTFAPVPIALLFAVLSSYRSVKKGQPVYCNLLVIRIVLVFLAFFGLMTFLIDLLDHFHGGYLWQSYKRVILVASHSLDHTYYFSFTMLNSRR